MTPACESPVRLVDVPAICKRQPFVKRHTNTILDVVGQEDK